MPQRKRKNIIDTQIYLFIYLNYYPACSAFTEKLNTFEIMSILMQSWVENKLVDLLIYILCNYHIVLDT